MSYPPPQNPYPPPFGAPPTAPGQPPVGYPAMPGVYPGFQSPLDGLLAPARRTGILMFVLGILCLLFAAFVFIAVTLMSSPEVQNSPEVAEAVRKAGGPDAIKLGLRLIGTLFFLFGAAEFVLAFFVRAGRKAALIMTIVVTSFALLPMLLFVLGSLITFAIGSFLFFGVGLGLLLLQLTWLIQATARSSAVRQWRDYLSGQSFGGYGPMPYPAAQPYPGQPYPAQSQPAYVAPYGQGPHPYDTPPPPPEMPPRNG